LVVIWHLVNLGQPGHIDKVKPFTVITLSGFQSTSVETVGCLWEHHGDLEWLVIIWIKLKVTLGFVLDIIPQTNFENSRFPFISSFTNPSYDQGDSTGQPIVSIFSVFIKSSRNSGHFLN
jgi:hypothetical protein